MSGEEDKSQLVLAYTLVLLTMVIWGSAFAGIEYVLREIDPYSLTMLRLGFAAGGLGVAGSAMRIPLPDREDLPWLFAIGVFGFTIYHTLLNFGISYEAVSAGEGSFVISTIPIWTAILAWHFLGETVTAKTWIGLALGLGGVGYLSVDPEELSFSIGSFVVLAAAVSAATNIVLQKHLLEKYRALHLSIYVTIAGALPMFVYLPWAIEPLGTLSLPGWAVVAYLGLVPIALGYFMNAVTLSILDASRTSQFLLLIPPIATVIAWLTLGEVPSTRLYIGGPMILVGVLLGNLDRTA